MENRKKLHDYGLVLVVLGIFDFFTFVSTMLITYFDGTLTEALAKVDSDILLPVKIVLGIITVIMGLLVFADVLLGIKALKISKKPIADKGYITIAKVFFVLSMIATVSNAVTLFGGNAPIADAILNFANSALGATVYFLFIKAAQAVRQDVLNQAK